MSKVTKNVKAQTIITRDGKEVRETVGEVRNIDAHERHGFDTEEYPNVFAAIKEYASGTVDFSVPIKKFFDGNATDSTVRDYVMDCFDVSFTLTLDKYLQTLTDRQVLNAKRATLRDTENRYYELMERIPNLKKRIDNARIIPCDDSRKVDYVDDVNALKEAYARTHKTIYLQMAKELSGAMTRKGYNNTVKLYRAYCAQLALIKKQRFHVVGEYSSVNKRGDTFTIGWRVFDTQTGSVINVKAKERGFDRVATKKFTYNLIGRYFIEPVVNRWYHEHGTYRKYVFSMAPSKETITTVQ